MAKKHKIADQDATRALVWDYMSSACEDLMFDDLDFTKKDVEKLEEARKAVMEECGNRAAFNRTPD